MVVWEKRVEKKSYWKDRIFRIYYLIESGNKENGLNVTYEILILSFKEKKWEDEMK